MDTPTAKDSFRVHVVDVQDLPNTVGEKAVVDLRVEHIDDDGLPIRLKLRAQVKKTESTRSKVEYDGKVLVSRGCASQSHPLGKFVWRDDRPFFLLFQLHSQKVFMTI
jgi:hypothetical protein